MKKIKLMAFATALLLLLVVSILVIHKNNQKRQIISIYLDRYNKIQHEVASLSISLNNEVKALEKIEEKELVEILTIIKDTEKRLNEFVADIPLSVDYETKEIWQLIHYELNQLPSILERSLTIKNELQGLNLSDLRRLSSSLQQLSSSLKLESASVEDLNEILTKRNVLYQYFEIIEEDAY